jgi:hypothetical protein
MMLMVGSGLWAGIIIIIFMMICAEFWHGPVDEVGGEALGQVCGPPWGSVGVKVEDEDGGGSGIGAREGEEAGVD